MNRRSFFSSLAIAAFAAPALVRAAVKSSQWVKREARFDLLGFIPKQDIVTCFTTDTYRTMLTFESPDMVRSRRTSAMLVVKDAHRIDGGQRIPVRNLQIDDCGWRQVAHKHWTTTNRRVQWEEPVS